MLNLLEEVRGAKKIGISGHIRPDGDCISSCLALKKYLQNQMPEAVIDVNLMEPMPTIFSGLCGYDEIHTYYEEDKEPYDVYFSLDCNKERLANFEPYFEKAKKTINLDHHISNPGCGDVNVVMPDLCSTTELLCILMEKDKLDKEIAEALYVGMVTDSGVFQYSNTSPDTMRRAADLMEFGFDFPNLIKRCFYEKTYHQSQIMGRCLMESIRFMNQRCIVSCLDKKTMDFYQVTSKHLEGIVNQLINIRGIDCAIFMYEVAPQEYKVSLRSTENVDVAKVASYFGGGGHVRAAGVTMKGTFHDCVNNLSGQIALQLGES